MTKETTQKIKGIAILIMILHHFIVYGYGVPISSVWVEIGKTCKICVGIYAVLSGYGYYFAKDKTVKNGLRKSWGLLKEYWITLFLIFVPCALMGGWKPTPQNAIINLFALGPNLNWNAWYVHFFIFCMIATPYICKVFQFQPVINFAIALIAPFLVEVAIHELVPNYQDITILQVAFNCMLYYGVFLVGFLMAKYDLIKRMKCRWYFGILLMLAAFVIRIAIRHINTLGFNTDAFIAPIFVIGAASFFENAKGKWLYVFSVLGKYSAGMWFFHAVFFATYVKDIFQPVMTFAKWPPLMFVWLVVLSFAGAWIFRKLLDKIEGLRQHI